VDKGDGTASLSGTPAAGTGGTYPLVITVSNGFGSDASQDFTLIINQPSVITSGAETIFSEKAAGKFTFTATGNPVPALSESGSLPSGVTFVDNGNGTATLSGTPIAGSGGIYDVTIGASNGVGTPASQSFILTVNQPASITSTGATTFTTGTAGTFTVTTRGVPRPTLTETGALPKGVGFVDNGNGSATLSGTPGSGTGGTYPLLFTAANGIGENATRGFTLTVNQSPAIRSPGTARFNENTAGTFKIAATGFPIPSLTETGALPSGLTFADNHDGTATLSGTPDAGYGGVYDLAIKAANGVGTNSSQTLVLTIGQAPVITSAIGTTFTAGISGSFLVRASGVPKPALSLESALPAGLTFVDNGNGTATLAGDAAARTGGIYNLTITASNGVGSNPAEVLTLTVNEAPAITTGVSRKTFDTGVPGTFMATASGFPRPTLGEQGALPAGITFVDNGDGTATLSGTAAAGTAGMYNITITAVSSIGAGASQSFTTYVVTTTPPVAVPPEVLKVQRKGTGREPTQLVLSFDQPMTPGPADVTDNYIIQPVVRGKVLSDQRQRIHVAKAAYAPNGESVVLTMAKRLPLNQVFQIAVNGHAPAGLRSALGVLLDGNGSGAPGTDLVMRFSGQASLAGIPGPGQPLPIAFRQALHPAAVAKAWKRGASTRQNP
jgi:hypothetical protein